MHQRSLSELQGVSTQRGASTRRTNQDRSSWSSKLRRGSGRRCLCPPRGAPLWAWLLLGALVVPGAWSFLSDEQEELLVELHNHYRGQVSPSASAMLPLKWDPSLKVIAEGYAAKCIWNHNPELEDTGENLFVGTGPLDLPVALEKWFLERLDYDFQNNTCDEDKMCGHYTQMVWAGTHRVGCAFHLCNNMEGLDWERVSFLVCNYYPAGNYEDERPYVEGDWCSRCPENLQKCENNLCAADVEEEEEDDDDEIDNDDEEEGTVDTPPPATSDPSLQLEEKEEEDEIDNDDEEEGTVDTPPPATSDPSLQLEEKEEEEVVPPPATTESHVQPTPSIPTTSARDSEDPQPPTIPTPGTPALTIPTPGTPAPGTPAPGTYPPEVPSTTLGKEKAEENMEEDEKKKERKEEEKRKETTTGERDVAGKIYHNKRVPVSAGSVCSPSLLLACLTGILTLRL